MVDVQKVKHVILPWVITGIVIVISIVVCSVAWKKSDTCRAETIKVREDMQGIVQVEKKKAAADIEEKYRADRISYEVMARRMAREQNTLRELDAQEK